MAIHFEEEYAHDKGRSFVPVDKRMVADDSRHVGNCHIYDVRGITVSMVLLRASERRPKKSYIPDAGSTTVQRQEPIMEREGVALVNPDGVFHLASEWRVLR